MRHKALVDRGVLMISIQKDSDYHKNVKVQIVCFQSIFLPIMHRQSILNVYRSLSMKIIEYDTFHQFFFQQLEFVHLGSNTKIFS